jgi:hypothetical protein
MIRSSVNSTIPVVTNWAISSGVRIVSMMIVGGGREEEIDRIPSQSIKNQRRFIAQTLYSPTSILCPSIH